MSGIKKNCVNKNLRVLKIFFIFFKVFHVCSAFGAKSSFLCPSGSIFNQRHFVCDWWYDFICDQATELYVLNEGLSDRRGSDSNKNNNDKYNATLVSYNSPSNSLSNGPSNDLSLASSGYANNLRDEGNLIYDDYREEEKRGI